MEINSRPPRRFRFSLPILFVVVTVAAFASLLGPPVVAWLFQLEPDIDQLHHEIDRIAAQSQKDWDAMGAESVSRCPGVPADTGKTQST